MIAAVLSFIGGLFQAVGKLFEWLYARKLFEAGRATQQFDNLKDQVNAAREAGRVREDERARAVRDVGRVPVDPFQRPDDGE